MISFVSGSVDSVEEGFIVIQTGGIGYQVFMPRSALYRLSPGQTVKIFTHMSVKDDGITLYGFADREDLDMFALLVGVPGVGPKAGLSVLDSLTPEQIINAVASDDYALLSRAQGVGKKTAQMICLKLKDKLSGALFPSRQGADTQMNTGPKKDATEALTALGYSRSDALSAVLQAALPDMTTEEIIKASLRVLRPHL